jgi:hypothetical protein
MIAAGLAALAAAAAPHVEVAVVGPGGTTVAPPRTVVARAARVVVGGHTCLAPRGTALAALAGARRAGAPAFRATDDGSCSPGTIYVTAIGRARAHGRQGWTYKVGRRAGTAAAGDPSGPFGRGRLASGARVLWFWCRLGPHDGCQRTLEVTVARGSVAPRAAVPVTVRGYDDGGRGVPVRGARVTLGGAAATTDGAGLATLTAPARRGRFAVRATRRGLAPGFPGRVAVR